MRNLGLGDLGFLGAASGSGDRDPFFSNVALLVHGNGANGSTTITDSSINTKSITVAGDAKISTARSKFGNGSILFNGSTSVLTIAGNADFNFGTGDYTIEFYAYATNNSSRTAVSFGYTSYSAGIILFPTQLKLLTGSVVTVAADSASFPADQWVHVAVARASGTTRIFRDGQLAGSGADSNDMTSNTFFDVGRWMDRQNFYWQGNIEELRVTRGIARYITNFTPPSAPFPNS